jgi:hypothetical protein
MPVGSYATFGECVAAQQKKGKSKESAQKICGAMEQKTKKKNEAEDNIFKLQAEMRNMCAKYPDLPACKKAKTRNEIVLKAMEMKEDLYIIDEILNEGTLKSNVENLLSAIMKRWAKQGAKKADIEMFREAVWLFRGLVDEKKGVIM